LPTLAQVDSSAPTYALAPDWQIRWFTESEGVLYHPFAGLVHAFGGATGVALALLHESAGLSLEDCVQALVPDCADTSELAAIRQQLEESLQSLLAMRVIQIQAP
jgi:hypothetical protein